MLAADRTDNCCPVTMKISAPNESIAGSSRSQPRGSKPACASITPASTGSARRRWASARASALAAAGSVTALIGLPLQLRRRVPPAI